MKTRAKRTNTSLIARGMICFSSLLLLFALSGSAKAQGDAGGMTPPSLTPGTPFGSYPLSGFDSVNLFNGNLNFHLPLLKVGGRGATQVPVMLKIEERWRVVPFTSCSPCGPVYYATYNWWTGYQVGYGPGVLEGRAGTDGEQQDIDGATYPQRTLTRFTFTASDGTEFELRDAISNGAPQLVDLSQPLHPHFYLRGSVFTTADGSSATFISCQPDGTLLPIYDDTVAPAYPAGYLLLGDGTRYRIDGGLVRWIQDRNGNRVNFYYEHVDQFGSADGRVTKIVDSLNRQVTFSYDVDAGGQYGICDEINYQGFAGTPRTIRISKGGLGTALRPDFPRTRPMSYLFPDVPGSDQTRFSPTVITAVWLADGTSSYKFYYNDYGELARVELPSGGATEYDWGAGMNNALTGGVINGTAIYRRVLERRVYPSSAAGTAYESRMTYSVPETWVPPIGPPSNAGYVDVKEYGSDPNTALLANRHYFYGSATVQPLSVEYSPWKTGKEYKTEAFDSDGVTALQRGEQTFLQTSPGWWTGTADDAPENNPRLTDSKSTLVQTGQVAKQHYEYDGYNNQKVIEEYDYGISSPPTYPVRRTEIDHVTTNESNNIDYTGTGIEADVNHRPYLRSLPQERRVYAVSSINGAKTLFAQTHFYYDQTAAQNRASLVGHDALYDTTYNKRGNLTSAVAWLNTGEPITTSLQYDIAGNVVQTTDGRGKASVIEFASSSNTYAFATTVKSAVPDATGQHGSTQQFITQYDYDLASGLLKTITNANGQVTTASYANDPFDRLKGITPPAGGGQKSFFYSDTPGNLYVQTQQQQDASTTLTATVRFDGLGRAYRSEQSEGSGSIFVDTVYGDLGRVSQVSNPYRTGDTVRYTTTAYDGLGRVHTVTAPGGASVTTDYLGNAVTVTDPAAKSKKTVSDALGRTIQVIEDPGDSSHLNYQTTYVYDVLNNLRQVTQGSGSTQQKRYYLYDSLGRLIRASNPEQEINTSLTPAMTDPITGRSQWSMALTYDSNGNLLTRTDPRNVTANYYYDDLNRVYKRDYTNNINQTPTVNFTYDGIGSTAQYALGQLTLVSASSISGFASSYSYDNFDAMGRVLQTTQTTDGHAYLMAYGYDLAGHLTSEQYPSGRVVTTAFDQAGRLNDVSSGTTHYLSQFSYTAHGGVKDLKLGNNLWQHVEFDPYRLQPTEIDLGSVQGTSDKLKLNYGYGSLTANNGDLLSQTITVPSGPTLVQSYTYDGVNRLKTAKEMQGATTVWQQGFSYDRFGNRSMDLAATTAGYEGLNPLIDALTNRITPQAGESYSYDKAGNLTHDNAGNLIDYDAENMQVQYGGTAAAQYFYDGGQHRVKAVVNGVTTLYVYDAAGKLLAEYGTGSAGGSGTSYVTTDALGTPRIITGTDAANPVKGRHDYLPFGEEIQAGVGGRTAGQGYISEGLRQKYTAKERDQETGLDYFASRYYASAMGRFLSADSVAGQVGSPQTMNRYAYVLNNPLALVDPTGHAPGIVENPDYYDDEQEARRRKAQQSLPQMTLVFDEKAAAEVNAGNGTWASHGYSSVLNEQVIITADDTQIDPGLGSALTDFINNTVIDPHKNDGDRMVEGLFIGELELAIAGAGIGVLGPAAMAGEGIDIVPIPLTIDIAPAKPEEDPKLYGPFHRYVNSSELDKIMSSGLVGGREPRNYFGGGLGPSVKAWNGPLPDDGISPAIEFYTPIRPSSQSPGLVVWHAGTPGVIPIPGESGVVGIPASITKVRR